MMKKLLSLLLVGLVLTVSAAEFNLQRIHDTCTYTLLSTNAVATGAGKYVEMNLYHTVHIITASNGVVAIDKSLDNTNWVILQTNSATVASVSEITTSGKWSYLRARVVTAPSNTVTVLYLGGN